MAKRIIVAVQNENVCSGIGQYVSHIVSGLAAEGMYELVAVVHKRSGLTLDVPVVHSRLPYRLVYDNALFGALSPLSYERLVGVGRCDLSIFPDNRIPSVRIGCKTLAVVHDLMPLRLTDFMRAEGHGRHWFSTYASRYRRIADRADHICAVSEYTKRDLISTYGIAESRVSIVSPGVDYMKYVRGDAEQDALVKRRLGLPDRYVLYFGNNFAYKNVIGLMRAYAALPVALRESVHLVISHRKDATAAVADELGVGDKVHYLGGVSEADKPAVYRLASAFGFMSYFEGFGIPVVEAMAAGVPVLVSNRASLPEVAGDAGLVVEPNDVSGAACALERMLEDGDLRDRMVAAGRSRAECFSWGNSIRQMNAAIGMVMGE